MVLDKCLPMESILRLASSCEVKGQAIAMEMLPGNGDHGQLFGWTLYRRALTAGGEVRVEGQVRDRTQVRV